MESETKEKDWFTKVRDRAETCLSSSIFEKIPFSPNKITAIRVPIAILNVLIHSLGFHSAAIAIFLGNTSLDWIDGAVARAKNEGTKEGECLDPLVDKMITSLNLIYGSVFIVEETFTKLASVANIGIDIFSQAKRGSIKEQFPNGIKDAVFDINSCRPSDKNSTNAAHYLGKIKFILQSTAILGILSKESVTNVMESIIEGNPQKTFEIMLTGILTSSAILGVIGAKKR
jgi:phosphatidylglycerophosphate synthase